MNFKNRHISRSAVVMACVLPVGLLFLLSLSRRWAFPSLVPQQLSIDSWTEIFGGNSGIGSSLFQSLLISLAVAGGATAAGFFCSKAIAYHKHRRWLLLLAYLPFVLSPVILAVCLKYYFIKLGLAGKTAGVILAMLIIAFPYAVIFFMGFWNRSMAQYEALVQTLGGSSATAFKKVILPMAKPVLTICFFQCFLIAWFEYGLTSVIGYGKVQTLTVKVYGFVTEANLYYAALSCCLLILPPIVLLWINKRIIFRQAK